MAMQVSGVLRTFGVWEHVLLDFSTNEQAYRNKETGEILSSAPLEVCDIMQAEACDPVYDQTPYRFVNFWNNSEGGRAEASVTCSCCSGTGTYMSPGDCPLCDGHGELFSGVPGTSSSLSKNITPAGDRRVTRVDIFDAKDDAAFILYDFLSPSECDNIIAQAEAYGLRSSGYSKTIRINDRVSIMGEDFGKLLFERAQPYLSDIELANGNVPRGVDPCFYQGRWKPDGLNPCFRVCKYQPGGFFLPHHDGGFDYGSRHRSIKTFMIYLNDGFEGGTTTFYKERQRHYRPPLSENVLYNFKPVKGSCLVFNHRIVHDGGELISGEKYILRTEVMYKHEALAAGRDAKGEESEDEEGSFMSGSVQYSDED